MPGGRDEGHVSDPWAQPAPRKEKPTNTEDVSRKGEERLELAVRRGNSTRRPGLRVRAKAPGTRGRPQAAQVNGGSARLTVLGWGTRRTGTGWPRCLPQPKKPSVLPAASVFGHRKPIWGQHGLDAAAARHWVLRDHLLPEDVPANRPVPKHGERTLGCPAPSACTAAAGQPEPLGLLLVPKANSSCLRI